MTMDTPHRRFNPLTGEWVLVSPHRARRPWLGQVEKTPPENLPAYDPSCYLCPSNPRAGGKTNPPYTSTFVFDNDFPALLEAELLPEKASPGEPGKSADGLAALPPHLFTVQPVTGVCRVVCFSPRHDLTLSRMSVGEIRLVVDTWGAQFDELGAMPLIKSVQIFENRGAMMGASNPHPHCQIWANASLPNEAAKEVSAQAEYAAAKGSCLLCDYLALEESLAERIVCRNDHFVVLVPFWAVWPFETLVIGRRHASGLDHLTDAERAGLAETLKMATAGFDHLFDAAFPYTMGWHQRPTDGAPHAECHVHAHFYPPLLRSATVRKFMVGYEMLGTPQRDITPESAAARLREVFGDQ
jgi:UDPglucose--hexose-1-phosphate uridylyltransferase